MLSQCGWKAKTCRKRCNFKCIWISVDVAKGGKNESSLLSNPTANLFCYEYCTGDVISQCSILIVLIAVKCPVRFLNTGYEHYTPNKQLTTLYAASERRGKQEVINHVPQVQVNNYQTLHPLPNPIA